MNFHDMSTAAILAEMGLRFARARLNKNISQAELAREAGIARKTLSNLENGTAVDVTTLIGVLRALELLDSLESMLPVEQVSAMELARLGGKTRARAGRARQPSRRFKAGNQRE